MENVKLPKHKYFYTLAVTSDGIQISAPSFADFHQKIHELLSKEKTQDFSLPIRKQSKRY